jgi:hypothetical protein
VLLNIIIVAGCGGSIEDSIDDLLPQSTDYGNHSLETAKYLPFGTSHSQSFVLDNIADYYKIVVSSNPGNILLSLNSDDDLYIELLDSSMNRVDHTLSQHGTNDNIAYFTDIAGEYYVKVGYDKLYSGSSSAYTIAANFDSDLGPRGDISFTLTWSFIPLAPALMGEKLILMLQEVGEMEMEMEEALSAHIGLLDEGHLEHIHMELDIIMETGQLITY